MRDMEANRRRNQIIAKRAVEKVTQISIRAMHTDRELYAEIDAALDRAVNSEIYAGHPDNACRMRQAQLCLRELELRGTQLQLPI